MLERFSQPVRSYGLSDRVAKVTIAISFKALADFIDLDSVAEHIKKIREGEMDQKQRQLVKIFLRGKERLDKGANPESIDMMFPSDDRDI